MLETREAATRPRRSRLLGICYLLYFVLAISSALFTLPGVAAIGLALSLTSTVLYAIVAVLFYLAFKPVDKSIAATAAVLGVAGCVITIFNDFGFAPASGGGSNPQARRQSRPAHGRDFDRPGALLQFRPEGIRGLCRRWPAHAGRVAEGDQKHQ